MQELIEQVEQWAVSKKIHKEVIGQQWQKVREEIDELEAEIVHDGGTENIEMELGDVFVTLIILAMNLEISPNKALEKAYNKIKVRKGKTVGGTFLKDECED